MQDCIKTGRRWTVSLYVLIFTVWESGQNIKVSELNKREHLYSFIVNLSLLLPSQWQSFLAAASSHSRLLLGNQRLLPSWSRWVTRASRCPWYARRRGNQGWPRGQRISRWTRIAWFSRNEWGSRPQRTQRRPRLVIKSRNTSTDDRIAMP